MFLSGYAPHVFDDVLDATEPITGYSLGDDAEPYCISCGASAGIFPTLGDGWRHNRGDGVTAKAEPYDAGHPAVIGWRATAAADSVHGDRTRFREGTVRPDAALESPRPHPTVDHG